MEAFLGSHKSYNHSTMDNWKDMSTLGGNQFRPPATRRSAARQMQSSNNAIIISSGDKKRWSQPVAAVYQAPKITRQQQGCAVM